MKALRLPSQLRSTIVYLGTIVLAQLASFVLLPVITRFLGPSEYGEYARALAVAGLIGMLGSSWIRNVGFRFYFDAKSAGTTRSYYWSVAALQAAVLIICFALGAWLLPYVDGELVTLPTLMAALLMILTADFQALTASLLRAEERSGQFAVSELSAAGSRLLGTAVGLSIGFKEPTFLFLAAAAASLVGGVIASVALTRRLAGPARLDLAIAWTILRRLPGALPFSLGQWFGRLADRLVLNAYASTAVVGTYAAGFGLGDRIVNGLGAAVFLMAWPDMLNAWNEGGVERARGAIRRYFQIYLWLTVGPVWALILFGDAVVLMLGAAYADAAQVLGAVAVAAWLSGITGGLNRHFELQKRYYVLSLMTLATGTLHVALNFVLVPRFMAVGAGLAYLGAQLVLLLVTLFVRDKRLVSFPVTDAGFVALAVAFGTIVTIATVGTSLAGLVVFAFLYAAATAVFWAWRLRRGWSAGR